MNWGKWIVVSFILFAAFIATLVTVCMREDVSLVSKEYYKEELDYQQQILRLQNTESLLQKPEIILRHDRLLIQFESFAKVENGILTLFCPANPGNDRKMVVPASSSSEHVISVSNVKHGMYHARFSWTMGGKDFYMDKVISL